MSGAYYNEIDPFAAAWLRELIKEGVIADGDVDERSIEDVVPADIMGYTQCHFFAGIGVWSYALRSAGFPDNRRVWTGSCPCQPFSAAGKGTGFADERHLWPAFFHLIRVCRPPNLFGEQVASKDGLAWLDLVYSDLEGTGYRCGAVDLCAAGVGAPHIRQRLWFVADTERGAAKRHRQPVGTETAGVQGQAYERERLRYDSRDGLSTSLLAHPTSLRCDAGRGTETTTVQRECTKRSGEHTRSREDGELQGRPEGLRGIGELGDTDYATGPRVREHCRSVLPIEEPERSGVRCVVGGFWRDADWIWCRDQKYRPVEPGTFPLVDGSPNRVGRLRGYGNAICAEAAKEVIAAYMSLVENGQGGEQWRFTSFNAARK